MAVKGERGTVVALNREHQKHMFKNVIEQYILHRLDIHLPIIDATLLKHWFFTTIIISGSDYRFGELQN